MVSIFQLALELLERREVALDPANILVTVGPRRLIEEMSQAIEDEDAAIKIVPPQDFIDAAFVAQDMSLARLLEPSTCARVHEQLGTDFLVLVGEVQQYSTDEFGGIVPYIGLYGVYKGKDHTISAATVIDLDNAKPLFDVSSHAQGISAGVAAFYGLFVTPMTGSSARDGLARGVVAAMRERSGKGPLKIAVLAAERTTTPGEPSIR